MRKRLLAGFILFSFVAMALLLIPIGFTLEAHENSNTLNALKRDTKALATLLANDLSRNDLKQAIKLTKTYAHTTGRQILISDDQGILIASEKKQTADESLLAIVNSVSTHQLSGVIPGTAVEGQQYYVAISLPHASNKDRTIDKVALIVTYPVTIVAKTIHSDWRNLGLIGLLMLLAACLFGFIISGSLVRPLQRLGIAVEAIGTGQLNVRAPQTKGPRELRRLAEAINDTAARLITLLEAQRTFVEDASHQLRTPLTALQLHLENLHSHEGWPETDDYAAVLSEVAQLNHLVDSLLHLARNEARSPVLVPVNVGDVARERVEYWTPFAAERELALEVDIGPSTLALVISGILEQVLDNLLSNAFDATRGRGHIRVRVVESNDCVELHVIDNGIGLNEAERALALHRFWRGPSNDKEGSGLGLSIVDQLLRLSNGSIELREAPGGGIDATVLLRRADD